MPLYDFTCKNPECKYEFEQNVPLAESEKEIVCKNCGAPAEKMISKLRSASSSWKNWRT